MDNPQNIRALAQYFLLVELVIRYRSGNKKSLSLLEIGLKPLLIMLYLLTPD
jgi:hypothetical protein